MATARHIFQISLGGRVFALGVDLTVPDAPADVQPPEAPVNLSAIGSAGGITLGWSASSETDVRGYKVYRKSAVNGAYALVSGVTLVAVTGYLDTTAPAGLLTYYAVSAVDASGNESALSDVASATRPPVIAPPDTTPPAAPSGVTAEGQVDGNALDWNSSAEADLAGYHVERASSAGGPWTRLTAGLLSASEYLDTTAPAGQLRYYRVIASDTAANESAPSSLVSATRSATPLDTTPPAAPGSLTASGALPGITLNWPDSAEVDLSDYRVYRAAAAAGPWTRIAANLLLIDSLHLDATAPAGATSYYRVTVVDDAGNESAPSPSASALRPAPPDTTAPATPSGMSLSASTAGVHISWTGNTQSDLAGYHVYRASSQAGAYTRLTATPTAANSYFDTTATAGATVWYRLTAIDASGNESAPNAAQSTVRPLPDAGAAFGLTETGTMAPASVHVNCLNIPAVLADPTRTRCQWNFGDPGGAHNTLEGWTAAHQYLTPGTYGITLTVTYANGTQSVHTRSVTIAANTRTPIHVAAAGNNANDGSTPALAVQTWARAMTLLGDNKQILLHRGDTFDAAASASLRHANVLVDAYGSGALPKLRWTGPAGSTLVSVPAGAAHVTIQQVNLTSSTHPPAAAIRLGGRNITVRGCIFDAVEDATNGNGEPTGVLLQDNTATGTGGYFAWVNGTDYVIVGNVTQDISQHVIRMNRFARVLIADNVLESTNRFGVNAQFGEHVYVAGNTVNGSIDPTNGWVIGSLSIGPLGDADGIAQDPQAPTRRTKFAVIENNRLNTAQIQLQHGAEQAMVRNNLVRIDGKAAILLDGYDSTYNRNVNNVAFVNNTAINNAAEGQFFKTGSGNAAMVLRNNLFVAPNFVTGANRNAIVRVDSTNLACFTAVARNVWPVPSTLSYAQGGYHYVHPGSSSSGYLTPAEWDALAQVSDETYEDVTLDGQDQPGGGTAAATAARAFAGVVTDINGKIRVGNNWTAGAVQR